MGDALAEIGICSCVEESSAVYAEEGEESSSDCSCVGAEREGFEFGGGGRWFEVRGIAEG